MENEENNNEILVKNDEDLNRIFKFDYEGQTIDKAYYESLGDDGWEYYEGSQHLIEGHYLVP